MAQQEVSGGVVHCLPDDMRQALSGDADALAAWEDITQLARNEWIVSIRNSALRTPVS